MCRSTELALIKRKEWDLGALGVRAPYTPMVANRIGGIALKTAMILTSLDQFPV
jgi:hypothetical protein